MSNANRRVDRARHRVAAAAAIALAALAVASAQASSAPKRTPKLAKMTLQPSDVAPGAHFVGSYTPAYNGNTPTYEGTFEHVSTLGGVKLLAIQTFITLWANDTAAAKAFGDVASLYEGPYGHQYLFQGLYALTGVSYVELKTARFGKFRSIGVGQQSLFVAVTFPAKPAAVAAGIVDVRVGRVIASVTTVASLGSPLADSVSLDLARRTAGHISAELAAAGSSSAAG